jgi:hypothetical protein
MSNGIVVKVDSGNRKFDLHAKVTILRQNLKQYRVRDESGTEAWIDKGYIQVVSEESGTSTSTPLTRTKKPVFQPQTPKPKRVVPKKKQLFRPQTSKAKFVVSSPKKTFQVQQPKKKRQIQLPVSQSSSASISWTGFPSSLTEMYRTDDRNPYRIWGTQGFQLKSVTRIGGIRTFIKGMYTNGSFLSKIVDQYSSGKPWAISASLDRSCGGYTKKFFYRYVSTDLIKCEHSSTVLGVIPKDRAHTIENKKLALYLNADTLAEATVIAVLTNHPGREEEVTFLTGIPEPNIAQYASSKNGPYKTYAGQKEFTLLNS